MQRPHGQHGQKRPLWQVCSAALPVVTLGLAVLVPGRLGPLLFLAAVGLVAVALGLRSPVVACVYLLVTTFFRLAIPTGTFPVDPFLPAFAGVIVAAWLWSKPWQRRLGGAPVDPITCAIGLYIAWNVLSMVTAHAYPAGTPLDPRPFSMVRFVLIGTVMPLTMFLRGAPAVRHRARHPGPAVVHPGRERLLGGGQHRPVRRAAPGVAPVHRGRPQLARAGRGGVQPARGERPGAHRRVPRRDAHRLPRRASARACGCSPAVDRPWPASTRCT